MECILRRFIVAFLTLEFTLMSFDLSSLKLTIIYPKQPVQCTHCTHTHNHICANQKRCIKWETIGYPILDMLHIVMVFEACFICCQLTCYILTAASFWQQLAINLIKSNASVKCISWANKQQNEKKNAHWLMKITRHVHELYSLAISMKKINCMETHVI